MGKLLKSIERTSKGLLGGLLGGALGGTKPFIRPPDPVERVLVLRLDQRIGNGILLLPLLAAVRQSRPRAELHLLIHRPVAEFLERAFPDLNLVIWPYDQPDMMRKPLSYVGLARRLRRKRFDVVLCSNNPDSFSLSHAVLGRLTAPKGLIGFDAGPGRKYYDHTVSSPNSKHYADATLDLWRAVDPTAEFHVPRLTPPESDVTAVSRRYDLSAERGTLIWLGATPGKILPPEFYRELRAALPQELQVAYAAGPADRDHVAAYPEDVRRNCVFLTGSLYDTAVFFSRFDVFIGPDTGPLHLAVVAGCRTLGVFLGSSPVQYGYAALPGHAAIRWNATNEAATSLRAAIEKIYHFRQPSPHAAATASQ